METVEGEMSPILEIDEATEVSGQLEETLGVPQGEALDLPDGVLPIMAAPPMALPMPTKAKERKIADLQAGNKMLLGRLIARKAAPHPMAVLAARVKALLAIAPDDGESLAVAEQVENPLQIVTNAIEGLCMMNIQGHPGLKQAFDLAFEEQMENLLKDVESRVNRAILQQATAGLPETRSKGGLILPGQG